MEIAVLQDKFKTRMDQDGVRDVLMIANERAEGCPYKCVGCGVYNKITNLSSIENEIVIMEQLDDFAERLEQNHDSYAQGYHLCIYNNGNILNPEELDPVNLKLLLDKVNQLPIAPLYLSLETRGTFINEKLLSDLFAKKLNYDIYFILGVESLTGQTEIYGKPNIAEELKEMFSVLDDFNLRHQAGFGLDANFIFLPEFYTEDRSDEETLRKCFQKDLLTFIDMYAGKHTHVRINIHPFYSIETLPYDCASDELHIAIEAAVEIIDLIASRDYEEELRPALFFGVNDVGYEQPAWRHHLEHWYSLITKINAGHHNHASVQDLQTKLWYLHAQDSNRL